MSLVSPVTAVGQECAYAWRLPCVTLLCHGACSSLHVLGMANTIFSNFLAEDFAVVGATLCHKPSR